MPKFSELPVATALNDTDAVPIVQGGANKRTTVADLRGSGTTVSGALVGGVAVDSFVGASDDAKLTAALSYAAAQTIKPPILFSNRRYTFSQTNRTVFSGMKLIGPYAFGNQQRSANSIPNDIRFTGTGTWWVVPSGSTFDVQIEGLCFQGNSGATFMTSNPGVLWTSVFRDLGFNLWKRVLGTPASQFLITACLFSGWWNVNNGYGCQFSLGGSDNNLWTDGMLLDSPQSITTSNYGADYHLRCDHLEKTSIGPIYITADRVSGIHVLGSNSNSALVFYGQGRCEGRNANTPCFGSNLRVDGGGVTFRDWEFYFGGTALNTTGHTGEGGVITVTGGRALFDGCWYDRATGVAETAPWIYQSGGFVRVRNIMTGAEGGTWSTTPGKPRVQSVGGVLDPDSSVVVL